MALFVDGPACTIDDLTDEDAGLLDVALAAGINVSTKLHLAIEEIRTDLHVWLRKPRPALEAVWWPSLRIEQIVVTPPLKRWQKMHALALVYRDAYFSQLVDRYKAKWQEYARLTRDVRESFIASGLGLVADPIVRAAPPTLVAANGPQAGGTFYASVAWVNRTGQEGEASFSSSITIGDGHLMAVTVHAAPGNAIGFNVYAGLSLDGMSRQNDVPLPVDATYLYVPGLATTGRPPSQGQAPDFMRPLARTVLRG